MVSRCQRRDAVSSTRDACSPQFLLHRSGLDLAVNLICISLFSASVCYSFFMRPIRLALTLFIVASIFVFGLFIGKIIPRAAPAPSQQIYNTATILKQVQTLSQLVTVKFVLEKVVVLEDVKWYGENRVLLIAHGIAKAGIDFEKLQPKDIRVEQNKISMTLPPPVIIDVYLDDKQTEVLERSTGMMRTFDKNLEQNARRQAVDELRRAAKSHGILKEADERAKAQLKNLFHQLGFAEVVFRN